MTKSAHILELSSLQALKEQRCQGAVSAAKNDRDQRAKTAAELERKKGAAEAHLEHLFGSPTFCPDRMLLAAGALANAEHNLDTGKQALAEAKAAEAEAHAKWHEARFRTDHLREQSKVLRREETRRKDERKQAESTSLRAALNQGKQP